MENVLLIVHLVLALALIGVVLLQRSEGGGLGLGGGGGGVMTSRGAATAMAKITWGLAAAFIATSMTLTILAAKNSASSSVMDRLGAPVPGATAPADDAPASPAGTAPGGLEQLPAKDLLLPPAKDTAEPATPPRAE